MPELLDFKCPCCGGAINFDSNIQKMKCPYCDTEFDVEALKEYDKALNSEKDDNLNWDTTPQNEWQDSEKEGFIEYVCNSCGGTIVGDKDTVATECPFCGNPVVVTGNVSGNLKPDLIIPFKLDKSVAKETFKSHLQNKKLLPKAFKTENHIDEIKGIYVPFWLFDADADAHIRYKATNVRTWSDSNYIYTQTNFYSVIRGGSLGFEAVPIDGSSKMADDLMESIEPFDLSQAVDFQSAYLAGHFADKYDVTAEESIERANTRIKETSENAFANTVSGYATVIPESTNISLKNSKARYALYPVWILNTTWKGNKYTFAMNGQTGRFVGDLPMDKGIYARWFALITAIGTAVIFGAANLIHLL